MVNVVYPGSFDPVTLGHMDLVERALRLFGKVTVAVADNPAKASLFTVAERVAMLREVMPARDSLKIASFRGLTVEFCKQHGHDAILRGLRTVSDFEFEYQMALTNRHLAGTIETVFVMPSAGFAFISSSLIRQVVSNGGDVSAFLPPLVEQRLKAKLLEKKQTS
jgi:pantetheine-phosphate adenylyltransferase